MTVKIAVPPKTVEVLENFSSEGSAFYAGEIRRVSEDTAALACGAGWAKDVDGVIATGERDPSAKKLDIQKVSHNHGATDAAAPKPKAKE